MYKFQYKISILNFLTCANLHIVEKPFLVSLTSVRITLFVLLPLLWGLELCAKNFGGRGVKVEERENKSHKYKI
jgi:hypothetical protein